MRNKGSIVREGQWFRSVVVGMLWCLVGSCLSGCTPSLYSIDMRYQPSGAPVTEMTGNGKIRITVASFEDHRKTQDPMLIGRVVRWSGSQTMVAPKYKSPQDAVANGFKDYVGSLGFTVSGEKPSWNGDVAAIKPEWGDVVIGGSIDELDVTCNDRLATKTYNAQIKITVLFADVTGRQIFYRTTAQSSASLDHVIFSEDNMRQQVNDVLSARDRKGL